MVAAMFEDHCFGVKAIQCGANSLRGGASIAHAVKGTATIKAGATSLDGGSTVAIVSTGPVRITAATLNVSGGSSYSIAGVHNASADVNLDNSTANYQLTKANG